MKLRKIVIYTRYSLDMQTPVSCKDQEREVRKGLKRLKSTLLTLWSSTMRRSRAQSLLGPSSPGSRCVPKQISERS